MTKKSKQPSIDHLVVGSDWITIIIPDFGTVEFLNFCLSLRDTIKHILFRQQQYVIVQIINI